ncbi:thiol reductant ABC exporter subunit CydD [Rhizobium rhizosphaerae]|uniref:Thiol reductant ABC exporter subunit CydD n=1 Tax=Xaviernesmea rhizosphaerae TaxID=1672749 RepID=A0A1Q9ALC4_9HYPH|nr:thiol reductant ABC exporter subunit CydD [Xaviernesmea rhizosphaerae]OLP56134.1 thiol reductant ABC exporter subunit CydD [Xaviernesmea rhizosphaerae]
MSKSPSAADRAARRQQLKKLARPGGWALHAALILPLVAGLLLVVQATLLAHVLDRAIAGSVSADVLVSPIAAIGALILLRAGLGLAGERCATAGAERIKTRLRALLFSRLLARDVRARGQGSGTLASVIIDQVDHLDGYFARFLPASLQATLLPLAFAVAVFRVDLVVALLFLVTAPLIPLFMALVGWGAEAAARDQANALSRLSGHFADRLRGIRTLKLFGREISETAAVKSAGEDLRLRTLRVLRIAFLSSAVLEFFAALGVAGVALYVGLGYLGYLPGHAGSLTLEEGLFCLLMAPEVYQPLRLMAAHYHDKKAAESALAEIAARLDETQFDDGPQHAQAQDRDGPQAAREKPGPWEADATDGVGAIASREEPFDGRAFPRQAGGLEIDAFTLWTPDRGRRLLHSQAWSLKAGAQIALLGESGIGKTSFLQALAGLRPFDGTVRLGGQPIDQIAPARLRRSITLLNQRPFFLAGTVADNLRFAAPDASEGAMLDAAQKSGLLDDLARLPRGLDTAVGPGGQGLSGGQAQRLALARVFLTDPALLLLDEPTAHLDGETEQRVMDALMVFAMGRSLVIATHSQNLAARLPRAWRLSRCGLWPSIAGRGPGAAISTENAA